MKLTLKQIVEMGNVLQGLDAMIKMKTSTAHYRLVRNKALLLQEGTHFEKSRQTKHKE